jgi:hypothetical protein
MFLNKNFFINFFILIPSILLLIYIFIKSIVISKLINLEYYYIYYTLGASYFIFSILISFLQKKIKIYFLIIKLSILIALYSFEIFITYSNFQYLNSKYEIYKKNTGSDFDKRNIQQIYDELNIKTDDYSRPVSPYYYIRSYYKNKEIINIENDILPLSSVSNIKTIHCNENGYFSIYKSDRYGFNNPDKEWNNQIEFLLVGDSFVHGACVNRPFDLSSNLRNLLKYDGYNKKSVINIGFEGSGPLTQYASMREYMNSNVKNILWFYSENNDFEDLRFELHHPILNEYLKNKLFKQNLKNKQNKINKKANEVIFNSLKKERVRKNLNEQNFLNIKHFLKLYNLRGLFIKTSRPMPDKNFEIIIKSIKELAKQNGSNLYFIYIPEYGRFVTNYDNNPYLSVKKIISKHNIDFIDFNKFLSDKENPRKFFPFEQYGHYNKQGYRVIAEEIYRYIKNESLN